MGTPKHKGLEFPLVGYRFHPTDQELIMNYLAPKVRNDEHQEPTIGVVDIYKVEPWDLPGWSTMKSDDPVWYFLCPREKKFRKGERSKRTTEEGYWKPDGKPRLIKVRRTKKVIGTKRTLVFHKGRPKGIRTKWVMHEYEWTQSSCASNSKLGDFVLCKLKNETDETSHQNTTLFSDGENGGLDMSFHDIGEPNHALDSKNHFVHDSTGDVACDVGDLSFNVTSPESLSRRGIMTSEFVNQNLVKQDAMPAYMENDWNVMSAAPPTDFGSKQEKADISGPEGLLAPDFENIHEVDRILDAFVDSLLRQEDTENSATQMPMCSEESSFWLQDCFQTPLLLYP